MRKELAVKGIIKMLSGIMALGLLLFLPAGTFKFPGAWRMIGVLFIPMFILGTVLLIAKPELLAKRLNQKETEDEQKTVILFSVIIFWMFLSMPVIIGSFTGLIPMVFLPYILVKRIINEEKVLCENLDGYEEYRKKVRYRLIPFIW